jgi:ribonuclease HII
VQPEIPKALARAIANHEFICGSDEVGLGAWAGSLVVCATVVHRDWSYPGVTDSKKLSPTAREKLYAVLSKTVTHSIVQIEPDEIDREGIGRVWEKAHVRAIQEAINAHTAEGHTELPFVIIDGIRGFFGATPLPKADLLIPAVSVASILAKVHRDHIMYEMDAVYPGYDFKSNVGYGVAKHKAALEKLGITPIHRMSYAPMSKMFSKIKDAMDLALELPQEYQSE